MRFEPCPSEACIFSRLIFRDRGIGSLAFSETGSLWPVQAPRSCRASFPFLNRNL
jgi:hypothetical protein